MKHIAATIIAVCAPVTASRAQSDAQPQWRWRTDTISKDVSSLEVQDTGGTTEIMSFDLARSSPRDLAAAVVVSLNDEMFVRKIE
jgi:hypothetical protein